MKITKETVEYVAHLARLELEPGEIDEYTGQIDSILQHIDALTELPTEGIEATSHAVPIPCVMRDDREKPSLAGDASLQNAPERKGSFFKVPPVIEVEP